MAFIKKHSLFIFCAFLLVLISAALTSLTTTENSPSATRVSQDNAKELFRFATVGDFDLTADTNKTLSQTKSQGVDFVVGLGDLSYGTVDEYTWCDAVKKQVGETVPFQLIAGNHDVEPESSIASQGHIDRFASCLPNRMPSMQGVYGQQYFFDYKTARIIAIAPDILVNGTKYTYQEGSEERNWLVNAINDARSDNKKWVFVAMHKNCVTFGVKKCEISESLLKLLVEMKVSLVLQGHEHAYMRSKQLAINEKCPVVPAESFNEGCVVSSQDNKYSAKNGTVILINGTGGTKLRELDIARPAKNYFADWHGANIEPSYGPSIIKAFPDKLVVEYVSASGMVLDKFEITE